MTAPKLPVAATGDGTTKNFALGFPVLAQEHVRVTADDVLAVLGTDYSIADATARSPTVKFATAPANAVALKFYRNTPLALYKPNPEISHVEARQAMYRQQEMGQAIIKLRNSYGQTALLAGTALTFVAPCDAYIERLTSKVLKAVTTGGAITVEVATVAVTGLTVTVADADAAGTTATDVPTTAQSTTTKVRRGQLITVTPAPAFATAGDVEVELELQPADF